MATTPAPESTALEHAAEELKRRGFGAGARTLAGDISTRLRHGELGALPVLAALAVIWIIFRIQTDAFTTPRNLSNLVLQSAVVGAVAIGIVLVLLLGEIDLSVGSIAGLTSAVLGVLIVRHGVSWWLAIIVLLAVGAAIGFFHGFWFAVIGVPSFVVTLAGLLGWFGVQLKVLGEEGTVNVFEKNIGAITTTYVADYVGWILAIAFSALYALTRLSEQARRRRAGLPAQPVGVVVVQTLVLAAVAFIIVAILNSYRGVPSAGLIVVGLAVFFSWVTRRTRFGRYIYAVGGNAEAARRAGINVARIRIYVFTLAGTLAAIGGLMTVSRLAAASTQTGGGTFLLEVIAAAVIGGTSLFGGRGTVWAALLGALVLGSVSNGLDLLGRPAAEKFIWEAAILLLAVTVDALARRGRVAAGR